VSLYSGGLRRRDFLTLAAGVPVLLLSSAVDGAGADALPAPPTARLLFTSQGKTAIVNADGTGLRYFDFQVPGQATWQPGPIFPDGRRILLLSMEPRRDGPGRPFGEYYTQTPTHLWLYDLTSGSLDEICTKDRLAPFITPALLLANDRILVQVVRDKVGQIYSMRLDGSEPREFTRPHEGFPYGLSLSPNGQRVAFHLATAEGYQVWTVISRAGTACASRGSPAIFTSVRAGLPTVNGSCMSIASISRIRATIGATSASVAPTAASSGC
jgi:TolB protein